MLFPVLLVLLCAFAHTAQAVDVRTESYLLTSHATPITYEYFGQSMATQGDTMIVGAPFGGKDGEGIVYEYTNANGQLTQRSTFSGKSIAKGDQFGVSVQLHDDLAVVGAPYHKSQTGAAYVFQRNANGWNEVQELTSSVLNLGARFGSATAISAKRIVVGAPCQDTLFPWTFLSWQGIFVVYDLKDGVWTEVVAHMPIQTVEGSQCGRTLAISGDLVFVSCLTDKLEKNKDTGVVYVYQVGFGGALTVREVQRLTGTGSAGEYFGTSLSVVASASQTLLYVGSQGIYYTGADTGLVTIFSQGNARDALNTTTSSFSLTTRLTPPPSSVLVRYFGRALQVRGDRLIVGAFGSYNAKGEDLAGLGFYYKHDGQQWVLSAQLEKTNAGRDRLGFSTGLLGSQGETVVLGADMTNLGGNSTGVVAVYNF